MKKIKLPDAKKRFLFGRFLIRSELAKILGCSAKEVALAIGKNGRLELESYPKSLPKLSFNISHSNNLITLATTQTKVGIDVEFIKKRNFLEIAEHFFKQEEYDFLKKFPSAEIFYSYWTLKESFIKCNGGQIFDRMNQEKFLLDMRDKKITSELDKTYKFATFRYNQNYIISVASSGNAELHLGTHNNKYRTEARSFNSFTIKKVIPFRPTETAEFETLFVN